MTRSRSSCSYSVSMAVVFCSLRLLSDAVLSADEPMIEMAAVSGRVIDEAGSPVAEVRVEARYQRGFSEAVSDAEGRFSIDVPAKRLPGLTVIARADESRRMGYHQLPWRRKGNTVEPVELTLGPSHLVTIQVSDGDGAPIAGAHAGVIGGSLRWAREPTDADGRATIALPQELSLRAVYAWKAGRGIDYRALLDLNKLRQGQPQDEVDLSRPFEFVLTDPITVDVKVVDAQGEAPLAGLPVYPWLLQKPGEPDELNLSLIGDEVMAETDASGNARFDWLPSWNTRKSITFWPWSDDGDYVLQRGMYEPANVSGELTIALHRLVPISGHVRDTYGDPAPRMVVNVVGAGYQTDGFRRSTQSDETGRYEIKVAPNMVYLLVVSDPLADGKTWAAAPQTGFAVMPGEPRENLDFKLRPATRLFGRVTMGPNNKPVAGQSIQSYQSGVGLHNMEGVTLPNPEDSHTWVQPNYVRRTKTDNDGRFELFVGPGDYDIRGPSQNEIEKFTITDETEREFSFHTPRPEKGRLRGLVVTGDPPLPVAKAKVAGIYRHPLGGRDIDVTTDENGRFDVERELHRTVMHAQSADGTLAGVIEIGPDEKVVTIPIAPLASATGRLIDAETDNAMPGREIVYGVRVPRGDDDAPWRTSFGGKVMTDDEGRFRLEGLVVGPLYDINVKNVDGYGSRTLHRYQRSSAEESDFGDLRLATPYRPPTLEERIAKAFIGPDKPARERYEAVLRDAKLGTLRVLLVLADPLSEETAEFFKARYDDRGVRQALYDYRFLALPTTGDRATDTLALAAALGVTIDDERRHPRLVILSATGDRLANVSTDEFRSDDRLDAQELLTFFDHGRLPPLDARQVLDEALAKAKAENKRVLVQETASWCGPCWLLSRFLDDHRETFEKAYVHVKVDGRWEHADEVMDAIEPNERGGIPWIAILDADGSMLANSNGPDGNIGYPGAGEPAGIAHFMAMLRETARHLTEAEFAALEQDLRTR